MVLRQIKMTCNQFDGTLYIAHCAIGYAFGSSHIQAISNLLGVINLKNNDEAVI